MKTDRRALLGGGAFLLAGSAAYLRFGSGFFPDPLEFQPIDDPAGFRRMAGGAVSTGFDPFFGLENAADPEAERARARVDADLCGALFGPDPRPAGLVPVAFFSDYYCPYCRVLTLKISAVADEPDSAIRVAWHEWPVLGAGSALAARAALAAKRQGAYIRFHKRLMKAAFQATPAYLEAVSEAIGIDSARLIRDMASAEIDNELRDTAALARRFGLIGTPALVVGRTLVQGAIGDQTLRRLIAQERLDGPITACAVS